MTSPGEAAAGASPKGPAGASPGAGSPQHDVHFELGHKPSGLRNPSRAMQGLGAGALVLEAIVLLLAIVPIRVLGDVSSATMIALVVGIMSALLISGTMRHNWGWWLGSALQIALLAAGLLNWMIGAVGVVFGLVWLYVLHVRRTVLH